MWPNVPRRVGLKIIYGRVVESIELVELIELIELIELRESIILNLEES